MASIRKFQVRQPTYLPRGARSERAFICAPLRSAGGYTFSRGLSPAAETSLFPPAERSARLKRGTPQLKVVLFFAFCFRQDGEDSSDSKYFKSNRTVTDDITVK